MLFRRVWLALLVSPVFTLCLLTAGAPSAFSQNVLTYHNNNSRTGLNPSEATLTLSNVNSTSFGKLFTLTADGLVDGEPLYLSAVPIPGSGTHNLLIVVTENDSVYAFDADNGSVIWHVTTLKSGETPSDDRGCGQVTPQIGITSTPVIRRPTGSNGVIYTVAMSKDSSGNYHQRPPPAGEGETSAPVLAAHPRPSFANSSYVKREPWACEPKQSGGSPSFRSPHPIRQ